MKKSLRILALLVVVVMATAMLAGCGDGTPSSGGTTTPPSGGTTTPPSGGTTTPPAGGTADPGTPPAADGKVVIVGPPSKPGASADVEVNFTPAGPIQNVDVAFGSHVNPGSPENIAFNWAAERMEDLSGGNIYVEVFEGATMGGTVEYAEQVANGTLTYSLGDVAVASKYAGDVWTTMVPFLYPNTDAIMVSMQGRIGDVFQEKIAAQRMYCTGMFFRGNRQLTTNRDIKSVDDLKAMKIRLPETQQWMFIWEALETLPVPIASSEVFSALQTGVVEAQENPISSNHQKSIQEVQKYTYFTNHVVDFLWVCTNKDYYDKLDGYTKPLIDAIVQGMVDYQYAIAMELQDKYQKEMEDGGMEFVTLSDELMNAIREKGMKGMPNITSGWQDWVYDQALADIASVG